MEQHANPLKTEYGTRDLAQAFKMNPRKVRAWLDYFYEYIQPSTNEKGHWIVDEQGFRRFADVVKAMEQPGVAMNEVRKQLLQRVSQHASQQTAASQEVNNEKVVPIRQDLSYQVLKQTLDLVTQLETRVSNTELYQKDMLKKYDEVLQRQKEEYRQSITIHEDIRNLKEEMSELREKVSNNFREMQFSIEMLELTARGQRRKKERRFKLFS